MRMPGSMRASTGSSGKLTSDRAKLRQRLPAACKLAAQQRRQPPGEVPHPWRSLAGGRLRRPPAEGVRPLGTSAHLEAPRARKPKLRSVHTSRPVLGPWPSRQRIGQQVSITTPPVSGHWAQQDSPRSYFGVLQGFWRCWATLQPEGPGPHWSTPRGATAGWHRCLASSSTVKRG